MMAATATPKVVSMAVRTAKKSCLNSPLGKPVATIQPVFPTGET